jgi:hypothetical protein
MSAFVYVTFHSSKAATELVHSKREFEQYAAQYNVKIENILADNGVYSAQLFKEACLKQQQNLTYSVRSAPTGKTGWLNVSLAPSLNERGPSFSMQWLNGLL